MEHRSNKTNFAQPRTKLRKGGEKMKATDKVLVLIKTEGYKLNPLYIEKRSKRLQLLVQPSLYNKVKAQAETEGCSVNDYIHRVLEEAVKHR